MQPAILLTGLLLLAPAAYVAADAADADGADADCMHAACKIVNSVCERVLGISCLGLVEEPAASADPVDCASSVCTEVNERVCQPLFGIDCVAAGSEADPQATCYGTPCDEINWVCGQFGGQCLGREAAGPGRAPDATDCAGAPCDAINEVCRTVGEGPCVR